LADRKVTMTCQVPIDEVESFSKYILKMTRESSFDGLSVNVVKKSPSERSFAPLDLMSYVVSFIVIVAEGPEAAKKLNSALKVLRKRLDSKKITYTEKQG